MPAADRSRLLRQRISRELPKLDTWLQRDLEDGSEHRLRSADDIGRSKEPHSVHQSDQALFIAAQRDLVACVSIQQQIRRADYEVSVNRLPLRDLTGDALKAILTALGVDGGDQGGTTSYKGRKAPKSGSGELDQQWPKSPPAEVNEWP